MKASIKKMIYLAPDEERLLKKIARDEDVSETEVVRRALDLYARERTRDPLEKYIGKFHGGPADGAAEHDRYLVEALEEKLKRGAVEE